MIRNKVVLLLSAFLVASCSQTPTGSSTSSEANSLESESASSLSPSSSDSSQQPSSEAPSSGESPLSSESSSAEASSSESGEEDYVSEDFEFVKWGDGLILKKARRVKEEMVVPSSFKGLPVREIYQNAFLEKTKLQKITLPEGITHIGKQAFYGCTNLTEIALPSTLKEIGELSFALLPYLESLSLPEGLERIGDLAFYGDESLQSAALPSSLKWMGSSVFLSCAKISYLEENGVKYLGNEENPHLLAWKLSLSDDPITSVSLHADTALIGASLFEGEESLTRVSLPENVVSIGDSAFRDAPISSILIGGKVEEIGDYAFSGCSSLTSCTIQGNALKTIHREAFSGALNLPQLTLPDSVESVSSYAFSEAGTESALQYNTDGKGGAYLGSQNNPYLVLCGLASSSSSLTINPNTKVIAGASLIGSSLSSLTIPDGVVSLGDSAFFGMGSLTEIVVPSSVSEMGESLFGSCESLKKIELRNAPEKIGTGFASDCPKLESLNIPSSVLEIESHILNRSKALKSIVIPNSVLKIEAQAFMPDEESNLQIFLEAPSRRPLFETGWYVAAEPHYQGEWHYVDGVPTLL